MPPEKAFDTSGDLLLQRYAGGIRLVKPNPKAEEISTKSISNIFNLSFSSYFHDFETRFMGVSPACAGLANGQPSELIKKPAGYFTTREYADAVIEDNKSVIRAKAMQVIEEHGVMSDNSFLHMISFKFPWYYEDRIVGTFGCSIKIDANSFGDFSKTISQLISTGLLNENQKLPINIFPDSKCQNIYFSQREKEVLSHLVRGKTAKEIAAWLGISKRTVEHYLENIRDKTNCHSKSELIDRFVDHFLSK